MRVEEVETIWGETSDGQTSRLQTDSAGCSIYFNYGRQHGGERFLDSASLEMTGG